MRVFVARAGVFAALLAADVVVGAKAWAQGAPACDVFSAGKAGHVDMPALQAMLARGCDVDALDADGETLFTRSISNDDLKLARWLLDHGARPDHQDRRDGRTPLHWLAQGDDKQDVALVPLLVRRGADVNAVARGGQTPLHVATQSLTCAQTRTCSCSAIGDDLPSCWRGNPNMVRVLLAHGADANAVDADGSRPLFSAVAHNQLDQVVALLRAGARPTGRVADRDTIWDVMKDPEPMMVRQLLAHGADANERSGDGGAALHALASHWYPGGRGGQQRFMAVARMLVARGADVRAAGDDGETPLHAATSSGFTALARMLIAAGAPVDASDQQGRTPLHVASAHGHADLSALLLQRGAAAARKDAAGFTPLHWLARARHSWPVGDNWGATVRLLARNGARFDAPDNAGRTPLFHATRDRALARLLISSGGVAPASASASASASDANIASPPLGASPLHVAVYRDDEQLVRALIAAGGPADARDRDGRTPLHWAAFQGGTRALAALVATPGVDIEAVDKTGRTPLAWAVEACQTQAEQLLRAQGARPAAAYGVRRLGACAAQKPAPLHAAARTMNIHAARALIAAGSDVNARDERSRTPLHVASASAMGVPLDLYRLLVDKGADVSARDTMGRSPLHAAYDIDEGAASRWFAEVLVCKGADPDARDLFGWAPLDIALMRGWRAPTIPGCPAGTAGGGAGRSGADREVAPLPGQTRDRGHAP